MDQRLLFVGREDGKLLAMKQLAQGGLKAPMLVFVQSKDRAVQLHAALRTEGWNALDVLHADRTTAEVSIHRGMERTARGQDDRRGEHARFCDSYAVAV